MNQAPPFPLSSQRGSILLIAMMLTAVIAISLGSYLALSRSNMQLSNRALYNSAAMNLAENGLEEGMYSINKKVNDETYDWSGWSNDGTNAWRKLSGYTFDQNATGESNVIVYNYLGSVAPKVVARSIIRLGNGQGQPVEKWVEVQLRKTSRYANGLVAKDSITFSGNNASVDSWNSEKNDDGSPRGSPVPYSTAVDHDKGTVASISVAVGAVLVQNADIWGYVKTGGSQPSVGSVGLIGPYGTPTGTAVASRISTDFTMPMEVQSTITTGSPIAAISNGDLPMTLGAPATTTILRIPAISGTGNNSKILTIEGNVTIVLTAAAGTSALSLTGQSSLNITAGSSLTIYAEGDIDLTGGGVANANDQPKSFTLIGTSTNPAFDQKVEVKGNGALKAVVDAPNAAVKIVGNGDVQGAVLGKTISVTGNAAFHYDESLADLTSGNPYRVSKWVELTSETSRNGYRSKLNF